MTLIEIMMVIVIIAFAAAGVSYSVGALARTDLKAGAGRIAAAVRYAYSRSVTRGHPVRIAFQIPGNTFSIEEAPGPVTLTRGDDEGAHGIVEEDTGGSVDPWAAARARLAEPDTPTLGASPFSPIAGDDGKVVKRYQSVDLGRRVRVIRLIVPHEPGPKEQGLGAVHFFPTGYGEHAVIHLSDGTDGGVYSIEIKPLTGRCTIRAGEYEPRELLGDPEDPEASEVED